MKAVLLISHGSRSQKAHAEVQELAQKLKAETKMAILEYAFLEVESPTIPEGIASCVKKGATAIVILPHFLNSGNHVLKDIPEIIEKEKNKYPKISITMKPHLGSSDQIQKIYSDLIKE